MNSHSIEVGDLVKTKGKVPLAKLGRATIGSLPQGMVTKIEGYRAHVAPGAFHPTLGHFSVRRETYVVDLRDLEKLDRQGRH